MKGSHAVAKQTVAAESQAQYLAELLRINRLMAAKMGIDTSPPDPASDAEVDARAAASAGSVPTREEALRAQAEERDAEAKKKPAIRKR